MKAGPGRRWRRWLLRLGLGIAGLLGAAWLGGVRIFAFPCESMAPTVRPGDYFVGMVGPWHGRAPKRFDLVIFDVPPGSKWAARKIPWMKRVVGLPGESVRFSGGRLFIDGRGVEAPFLHEDGPGEPRADFEMKLKADEYFVLGDNLRHSFEDSRSLGPIHRSLLRGLVVFVFHTSSEGRKT